MNILSYRNQKGTQYSKLISAIPEPDIAISMGCNVACPFIGRPFDENWGLDDPTGKSDEEFKTIIEEIRRRVLDLKARKQTAVSGIGTKSQQALQLQREENKQERKIISKQQR